MGICGSGWVGPDNLWWMNNAGSYVVSVDGHASAKCADSIKSWDHYIMSEILKSAPHL